MSDGHFESSAGPQQLGGDLHALAGLVTGIALDGRIQPAELHALRNWCDIREGAAPASPVRELIERVRAAVADDVLDEEERGDILWMCERAASPNPYFNVATNDLQRLRGLLAGIGADRVVSAEELAGLSTWMQSVRHLKGSWPYDEIEALITSVLADGVIDEDEHRYLVAFCSQFLSATTHLVVATPFEEALIRNGVCASKPEIVFEGKTFCVTGNSPAFERHDLERAVAELGGVLRPRVVPSLDYLVVAAAPGAAWAFSCYGRKVELAMRYRKEGARIAIVHETDFWDAARRHGVSRPGRASGTR